MPKPSLLLMASFFAPDAFVGDPEPADPERVAVQDRKHAQRAHRVELVEVELDAPGLSLAPAPCDAEDA